MRVLVLGAGFGGLELTTSLSEQFGDQAEVVLIDQSDDFVFGFSKLDVMFGRIPPAAVRHPYRDLIKPGVRFVQATVTAIDPAAKRAETDAGVFEADVLVVALGADLDPQATSTPRTRRSRCKMCSSASPVGGWLSVSCRPPSSVLLHRARRRS
jgi:sulfide:quinone oxidoreductase